MTLEVEGWLLQRRLAAMASVLPPTAGEALRSMGEHEGAAYAPQRQRLAAERSRTWKTYQYWWNIRWIPQLNTLQILPTAPEPPLPPPPPLRTRGELER